MNRALHPREFPKRAGKKMLRRWLKELKEIRSLANYENADFDPHRHENVNGLSVTDFIRIRTREYRNTWVNSPIDQMINEMTQLLESDK